MNKTKTIVMRVLDKASIPYRTMEYEVDESDLSGVHVAEQLGQPCEQIFKTLVLKDEKGGHYVCCIPVDQELDLKKVARACKAKKVEMLPLKELLPTTGYIPTYIDETAQLFDEIAVSGGVRGEQVLLHPEALGTFTEAVFADLVKD